MSQVNLEAKLKQRLKQEQIQLWKPPYTGADEQPGQRHLQELSERYAHMLRLPAALLGGALESIRLQTLRRGHGNRTFRETQVATLELLLPRSCREEPKSKSHVETKLDVSTQELADRIGKEFGLSPVKLIVNGRTLSVDQRLDQQGVKNHSKVMVLKVSDGEEEKKKNEEQEEKKKNQEESIQRTHKAFHILSTRDGSEDPESVPFLEIADQKGNPLKIPDSEKKALILAMGFHERGRSLMKKKQFSDALCHLLQADQHFSECGSELLSYVDNFAVLQLDVVWCYAALEALSCLEDGRARLQRAHEGFQRCYGQRRQRLLLIQGTSGREDVLFLRLHLLQSLLSYLEGNDAQAQLQLAEVEALYGRLVPDCEKMSQLMVLGFSETEARLGLRACEGRVPEAAEHISSRRQERERQRSRERRRRSRRSEVISSLEQLGFSHKEASRAAHLADGDLDRACAILLDSGPLQAASLEKLQQLTYLGFQRDEAQTALRLMAGDVQAAAQLLLDHQGELPSDSGTPGTPGTPPSPSSSSPSPSSEEPSTSSNSAEERELVREVLEELPEHEEDYLDLTLEEESQLIATLRSYLGGGGGGGGASHAQ